MITFINAVSNVQRNLTKFINGIKQVIVKIYEIYEENCKICQLT